MRELGVTAGLAKAGQRVAEAGQRVVEAGRR